MIEFKPYEHQLKALEMSKTHRDLALLWEMGTGKTSGMILILRSKYNEQRRIARTLILGPAAVIFNWQNEIRKYSSIADKYVHVVHGTKRSEKLSRWISETSGGIVITNYESLLSKELFKILSEWKPEMLVCDESHMLKNPSAQRSKLVKKLSEKCTNRFILTGTPILQNSMDIFMQFLILDQGETFGKSFFVFRSTYFRDTNSGWRGGANYFPNYVPIPDMVPILTKRIYTKALRVLKSDVLDLPERIEQTVFVELSTEQERLYKQMKKEFITFIQEKEKTEPSAVVAQLAVTKALRLQQIVSGFVATDQGNEVDLGDIPRLKVTQDLLEQIIPNHKVILWCSFKRNYEQLSKLCDKIGVRYVLITGDQDAKEKQISVDTFQNDAGVRVCIANRRAGGTGINLIAASYSITYSRNFSLAEELQSRDRNHRGGSQIHEKIIKIDLVAKDTVDELCMQALTNKEEVSKLILSWKDKL